MFCKSCGKQIADDSMFCAYCGEPQADKERKQSEGRWETCEIVYEIVNEAGFFSSAKLRFWAEAKGPNGTYNAGESETFPTEGSIVSDLTGWSKSRDFPTNYNPSAKRAHKELVNKLLKDGWNHVGGNDNRWWADTFRRSIKA